VVCDCHYKHISFRPWNKWSRLREQRWKCHRQNGRNDCWGHARRALYLGKLYVGSIMPGSANHHPGEWRAWFMSDEDGEELGWFQTEAQAKTALEDRLEWALGLC
jgi:hypothetical protein